MQFNVVRKKRRRRRRNLVDLELDYYFNLFLRGCLRLRNLTVISGARAPVLSWVPIVASAATDMDGVHIFI